MILIIKLLNFLYQRKILVKLKWKKKFVSIFFVMKTNWVIQFTYQIKNLEIKWICCLFLMKINHIMCTSKTDRFMFSKTKSKNKKCIFKSCWQCFSSKNVLTEHKEVCLKINGKQAVKLKGDFIEFKNCFKKIPVAFKISAIFECILKSVKSNKKN